MCCVDTDTQVQRWTTGKKIFFTREKQALMVILLLF